MNQSTDVEIPRSAWSPWTEAGKPRLLRRLLTDSERRELEARRDELLPAIEGFGPQEQDRVVVAIANMFGGYTSMRQSDDEAVARIESVLRVLADFPAWSIEKTCKSIQMNGVWREGKFDRQWPPNDSEIVDAVRKEVRLYADCHRSAVALLDAKVEEQS